MYDRLLTSIPRTCFLAAILLLAANVIAARAASDDVTRQTNAAVDAVRPALIMIHMVSADFRQGRELKAESAGSGVIISPKGYAVTNHHVAADAERIVCTLADKREVEAKLVGTDPLADIAVIKLASPDGKPFPCAKFGDSSKLRVGDRVFAMGCPLALSQSVTTGIVSNKEMMMPSYMSSDEFRLAGEDVGSIVRWIGHDALIRPGNSGGPLVSPAGEIVGINEISYGLSGAIPSNLARDVANQLIKRGKVVRSWLGLEVQPLLKSCRLKSGILVSGVLDGSPAQKAGFKSGDILQELGGRGVSAHFKEEVPIFNQFVAVMPVGKTVSARVNRGGKNISLKAVTAERQKAEDKQHEIKSWGICTSNITYLMQKEMQLPSQDGAMVTGVLPSGPAGSAKPSLREGDVIVSAGGKLVKDVAALRAITKNVTEGHTDPVPIMVNYRRNEKDYATVVKIGRKEISRAGTEATKAWLPIDLQVLTSDLAQALGVPGKTGVRITQVHPGTSAEKARLKVGDLIVKLDGEAVPADQLGDEEVLPSQIRQYDIGAEVVLGVIRDGKSMDVKVILDACPRPARDYPKYEDENFEFTARDIAFSDRTEGPVEKDASGVYVESVVEGSWCALANMRSGDVITQIDGASVSGLDSLKQTMSRIARAKPKHVVFKLRRGIHTLFVEVEPDWPTL
ncbi:MAG: PDZ domain-containing protein [Armatimonadetes bacterium]|nr:PDZ domain-containing protein [Armatimonadota bacterium]